MALDEGTESSPPSSHLILTLVCANGYADEELAQSLSLVSRDPELCSYLVKVRFFPNGQTLLHAAAALGHVDRVAALIAVGADKEVRNTNFLSHSATERTPAEVGLRRYKNPNTPLLYAATRGHAGVVSFLLDMGLSCEGITPSQSQLDWEFVFPPLILACYNGWASVVRVLLDHGARPSVASHEITPLLACALHNISKNKHGVGRDHVACARLLLQRGADTESRLRHATILHFAVEHGAVAIVDEMLRAGANVSATVGDASDNFRGSTVFHAAGMITNLQNQTIVGDHFEATCRTKAQEAIITRLLLEPGAAALINARCVPNVRGRWDLAQNYTALFLFNVGSVARAMMVARGAVL